MTDNPLAAALARLRAEHADLPTDGGPVWEPVQDDEAERCPESEPRPPMTDTEWADHDASMARLQAALRPGSATRH